MSNAPKPNTNPPKEQTPQGDSLVAQEEVFSYDGYQVVRGEFFSHPIEPYVVLNRGTVGVSPACIRKFPDLDYVQFMINPDEKKLVIRPCPEETRESFRWAMVGADGGRRPKTISCRIFFGKVMELMGWHTDYRYKILGKLIRANGESLFVFTLENAEVFPRKDSPAYLGPNRALYPEDWHNQFGIPAADLQKDALLRTFDEYTVLEVEEDPAETAAMNNTDTFADKTPDIGKTDT